MQYLKCGSAALLLAPLACAPKSGGDSTWSGLEDVPGAPLLSRGGGC